VLPKDYGIFRAKVLEDLLRLFNSERIQAGDGDVFGRIYEYFLAEFSIQKAHDNGEFYTPSSIVKTIVNVIEPTTASCSIRPPARAAMFVQSSHFIEHEGGDTAKKVVFYRPGEEPRHLPHRKNEPRGATAGGKDRRGDHHYQTSTTSPADADFVMANPPFNVDLVRCRAHQERPAPTFGLPGRETRP